MKVLQLIQRSQLRGAEIFACQLSNHLRSEGHEVHLISLLPGDAVLPFKGPLIKLNRSLHKRLMDIRGWSQLARYIRQINPDVVQANAGDTLKFAVLSKLIFRWKTPIVYRNANKVSDFIDSKRKLLFNRFLVNRVSHVISVSDICRRDFIKTYSVNNPNTVTTVPIGIELEVINRTVPSDLKSIFEGGNVLVNVASFVPEKNHSGLLRIIRSMLDNGNDVKVLLVGDGKQKPLIQQKVAEMNLGNVVFFTGYRNDVLSIITNAKAFILPSRIEGLPGVILEAMYCRTPVIAYDVGGISEVVKPYETGWLVKAGDESAFSAAVHDVLNTGNLGVITDNAYNLVVNDYSNRIIARKFLEVYKRLLV